MSCLRPDMELLETNLEEVS